MYCNNCFEEIPDGSTKCPYCGADLTKGTKEKKKPGGSLFGGSKKKNKKSGGPYFDEYGNLIDSDKPNTNGNTGGGRKRGGRDERGSGLDPKILIILVASLILLVIFIISVSVYMKKSSGSGKVTRTTTESVPVNTSSATDSFVQETVTPEAESSTTTVSETSEVIPTVTPTVAPTLPPRHVTESKSDSVKSSFDKDTAGSFFWPYADRRLYTFEDLENLSIQEIEFIKAEIYAREGCIFKDKKYGDYFKKKSWFRGSIDETKFKPDRYLNYYELENVRMIDTYIKEKK